MFVTDEWLKERANVHRSTVARWRAQGRFPAPIERLAQIELEGRLELVHAHWDGWKINARTGELVAPGGMTYTPAELLAVPIRFQLMRELERRVTAAATPAARPATFWERVARYFSRRPTAAPKITTPATPATSSAAAST